MSMKEIIREFSTTLLLHIANPESQFSDFLIDRAHNTMNIDDIGACVTQLNNDDDTYRKTNNTLVNNAYRKPEKNSFTPRLCFNFDLRFRDMRQLPPSLIVDGKLKNKAA